MSNVIKPFAYFSLDNKKVIESVNPLKLLQAQLEQQGDTALESLSLEQQAELQEANSLKDQILRDAEAFADEQIQAAMQECAAIREQTEQDIAQWWEERRSQDEELLQQSTSNGFEQGFQQGLAQAEAAIREEYTHMLNEARAILEQSYALKSQIVQESEPFLIDLSTSIAEKIIGRQLTLEPEWVVDMIQSVLSRRKEKGSITLCVAPQHFAYIQDAREELLTSIDSQAELAIIPDSTVQDHGCVIRSSFGSIDARIDTQLKEVKSALRHIAIRNEGVEA